EPFGNELSRTVDVGVRHGAAGVGLEGDVRGEPCLTGAIEHGAEVATVAAGEGMKEPVLAVEERPRTGEPCLRHARRTITRLGRPAGMHALSPGPFSQVFDDARRHASGNAERVAPRLVI